jgi:hypothetical protein
MTSSGSNDINIKLIPKQIEAFKILQDNETTELLYGGAARSAKSWLGCVWQITRRIAMPNSAGLIAREELTKLRDTTLITFFKVSKAYGFEKYYKYNAQSFTAEFYNGSIIFFREIKYLPSDPEFDRLGSYDLTDCFLDEAQQINSKAISVLKGRFSVLSGNGWQTIPKALYTCNPKRNWIYSDFVKPNSLGTLPLHRKFIPALPTDNPYTSQSYIDNLLRADKVTVQRLYYGNFDYDDDPATLCDYDAITDLFTNDHVIPTGKKYISADLAMKGRDKFIVGVWDGLICNITIEKDKCSGKEIEQDIKMLMNKNNVPHSRTIVDSDGLGAYLESYLTGIKEFHGGAAASQRYLDGKKTSEYNNLKSECGFKLAELINERKIKIICTEQQKEQIISEIGVLKIDKVDNDTGKKAIISKDKMKELLQGKSPDYLDQLLMRMYFEIKKEVGIA